MKTKKILILLALVLLVPAFSETVEAQRPGSATPRQERLLNGLKVLMWNDPSADKVTIRLRIHSGSAFDQQGKEGTMKMLSEVLFPNDPTRDLFAEDLGGGLELISNYDFIQINASSRPGEMVSLIENIALAVVSPRIDAETTGLARERVMAELSLLEGAPEYIADRAVAARLFGTFPYGRPDLGTQETLEAIDFADLRFAYDRLFGADNATLAISGRIDANLAFRAVRRFFGSWRKADRQVPPNFRRPDEPAKETLIIGQIEPGTRIAVRTAVRGVARNEKDYHAYSVLASIMEERLRSRPAFSERDSIVVRHDAFLLPGMLTVGYMTQVTAPDVESGDGNSNRTDDQIREILQERITGAEFSRARNALQLIRSAIDPVAVWLDADTYRFASLKAENEAFSALTPEDVQRAADRVSSAPAARVVVIVRPLEIEK